MTHLIDTPQIYKVIKTLPEDDPLMDIIKEVSPSGKLFVSVISHGEIVSQINSIEDQKIRTVADQNYKQLIAAIGIKNLTDFSEPVSLVWADNCIKCPPDKYPDASAEAMMIASTAQYYGYEFITEPADWHAEFQHVRFKYT